MKEKPLSFALTILLLILSACEDFVQIDPPKNELSTPTVFSSDMVATSAIRGMYRSLSSSSFAGGLGSTVSAIQGIAADELTSSIAAYADHYNSRVLPTNSVISANWTSVYYVVYLANCVIEGVSTSDALSPALARFLEGEARFVRAFCYMYLVNLWGDVPLVLSTDYRFNSSISRSPASEVYEQIITDLIEAQTLLPDDYNASNGLRTRANRWVATALLARVYLYTEQWEKAEQESTSVIEQTQMFELEPNLNDVFLIDSREAIFQLYPTSLNVNNSREARLFLPNPFLISLGIPPTHRVANELLEDFEDSDDRRGAWIDSVVLGGIIYRYPHKYKVLSSPESTEFTVVMRLAEQYLIRAEARARLGKLVGLGSAESDLNTIRARAGLEDTTVEETADVLEAIMQERRVELFSEWGHRWFDLVRTGRADLVLGEIKEGWSANDVFAPIPQDELNLNPFLIQNEGY